MYLYLEVRARIARERVLTGRNGGSSADDQIAMLGEPAGKIMVVNRL
jgi:hypothetical protein